MGYGHGYGTGQIKAWRSVRNSRAQKDLGLVLGQSTAHAEVKAHITRRTTDIKNISGEQFYFLLNGKQATEVKKYINTTA